MTDHQTEKLPISFLVNLHHLAKCHLTISASKFQLAVAMAQLTEWSTMKSEHQE